VIQDGEINFVLSGGNSNSNPALSLGGLPSNTQVGSSINALFDDVTNEEMEVGVQDYRCIYIFNDSDDGYLYNCKVYVYSEVAGGASVQIGVTQNNDVQVIQITSEDVIQEGSYTVSFEGNEVEVVFDSDFTTWGQNLQTALNDLDNVSGVIVNTSTASSTDVSFTVSFAGEMANKYFELMTLVSNNLLSNGDIDIEITKDTNGSPINIIAGEIAAETVAPANVSFQDTSSTDALIIGTLGPTDGFPVWIKRTSLVGADAKQNDGFTLRLVGNPF
jgi:hypothetical protein